MKFKILIAVSLVFCLMGVACAGHVAESGPFIYKEVEDYNLSGFNFTVPTDYGLIFENETTLAFEGDNDSLVIEVIKGGEIQEINATGNMTADHTMFGSAEGYLIDNNGTYAFSYVKDGYLIGASSKDMTLMLAVLGLD